MFLSPSKFWVRGIEISFDGARAQFKSAAEKITGAGGKAEIVDKKALILEIKSAAKDKQA